MEGTLKLKREIYLDNDTLSILIDKIFESAEQKESLTIDFHDVKFIDACYIPIFKALTGLTNINFKKSSEPKVNKYILEQDGQKLARDTVYPMKISRDLQHISFQTKELIEYLKLYLNDEETGKYIAFILQELVSNIFDHSGSLIGAIINGQVYPNRKIGNTTGYVQLTVLDTGVGFKETLSRNYSLNNEIEAINKAIERNVTGATKEGIYGTINNVGFGLYAIKEFIKYLRGRMIIVSNNGLVQFTGTGKENPTITTIPKQLNFGWKGSIVIIEVPMDTLQYYEFDVLMELIRKDDTNDFELENFEDLFEDF